MHSHARLVFWLSAGVERSSRPSYAATLTGRGVRDSPSRIDRSIAESEANIRHMRRRAQPRGGSGVAPGDLAGKDADEPFLMEAHSPDT